MISLQSEFYVKINHYLLEEPDARKAFGLSCRYFYLLYAGHERSFQTSQLARFIIANYSYFTNIDANLSFNEQLGRAQVFLLGENHLNDDDRVLVGKFTHLVWKKNLWAFLVEGTKQNLGTSQIKYVSREVAQVHESWDNLQLYLETALAVQTKMKTILYFTRTFLIARDVKNEASALNILEWLCEGLKQFLALKTDSVGVFFDLNEMKIYLHQCSDTTQQKNQPRYDVSKYFKFNRRDRFELHLNRFFLYIINLLTHLCTQYAVEISQLLEETSIERENQMVNKTILKLRLGQKVINVAGLYHTKEKSQAIKRFDEENILYMSFKSLKSDAFAKSIVPSTEIELEQARDRLKSFNHLIFNQKQEDDEILTRYYCLVRHVLKNEKEQILQKLLENNLSKPHLY